LPSANLALHGHESGDVVFKVFMAPLS